MIKTSIQSAILPVTVLTVLALFCALSAIFPLVSFAKPNTSEKHGSVEKINAGVLYDHWCAQCHGLKGKADGINSTPDMAINPRDLTDKNFMVTRSDKQFEDVIRGGGTRAAKSPLMPAWEATLTDAEIDALVVYLRVFCKCEYEGVVSHEKLRLVDPDFK